MVSSLHYSHKQNRKEASVNSSYTLTCLNLVDMQRQQIREETMFGATWKWLGTEPLRNYLKRKH